MSTQASRGFGAKLAYADIGGTDPEYTFLSYITDVPLPELALDDIEISNQDSPTDENGNPVREWIAGWADAGELTSEQIYNATDYATLRSLFGVTKAWQITLSDGATIEFDGYVKTIGGTNELEDATRVSVTIKISGLPKFTDE